MRQLWGTAAAAAVTATLLSATADAQVRQVVTGPVSTYWMTAETVSGLGAMSAVRGMAAGSAMMAGGAATAHNLHLQLGSSRKAPGEPTAEHLPPAALKAGASLPLVTPRAERASGPVENSWNAPTARPKGKMLIYWGCGEKARPGQPVVIDFAKLAAGQTPPALAGVTVKAMTPPSPDRHATYGEWPNPRSHTSVPASGSLIGEHVVRGSYTPEIRFALTSVNDFLAPIAPMNATLPSGAVRVTWRPVTNAQAYFAGVVGSAADGTLVMWNSSERQLPGMSLPDFMAPDDIARLTQQKVLMSAQTSECAVPAEVASAVQGAMLQMTAYGPEANLSYPPRPRDPKQPWNIEWTAKVRSKSAHMGMLGMDMPAMAGRDDGEQTESVPPPEAPAPKQKRSLLKGLGGIIGTIAN